MPGIARQADQYDLPAPPRPDRLPDSATVRPLLGGSKLERGSTEGGRE